MITLKSYYAVAACAFCLVACSKPHASEASSESAGSPVQVAEVKRQTIHNLITVEAILYPVKQSSIVPKISAPVARFLVQRGDHVHQGQLIAVLEDRDLKAATQENKQLYDQAQANYRSTIDATLPDELTRAKSDLEAARQSYEASSKVFNSRQDLFHQGALSQRLVEDARVALVQARAALDTAQQHLAGIQSVSQKQQQLAAQAQLNAVQAHYEGAAAQESYAEIRSPISGVVSDRPLNPGEMATSGSPLISIIDISHVVARANVPADQAAAIHVGREATISAAGAELTGKVTVVSPAVDLNTTTVQIWVEVPNPSERFKLGTTAQISIDAGEVPNALTIPSAALLTSDEGGEKVMVAGSDSLAHERAVKIGIHSGDDVQVLSGLKQGERVITEGVLGLDDKAKIEISKAEPK